MFESPLSWLNTLILICMLTGSFSANGQEQKVIFSIEGYCILKGESVDSDFLTQYSKKLGFTPKSSVCKKVNRLVKSFQPKGWDYKFNRAYPGSAIMLTNSQIIKIKEVRAKLLAEAEQKTSNND